MTDTLPARHNIYTYPDTAVTRVFQWLKDGEPVDISNYQGRLRIGLNGQLLTEVDGAVTFGGLGGLDGILRLDIPAGILTDIGTYWYVLDLLDSADQTTRFVVGSLRVSAVFQ